MGWKRVLAVSMALMLVFSLSSSVFAQELSSVQVCYKDYFGKEACVSASKVKWHAGGFVIAENTDEQSTPSPVDTPSNQDVSDQISIVYFGDLQSVYYHAIDLVMKSLEKDYGSKVSIEFLHEPSIESIPYAEKVAEASECARDQGKFEEFKQKIFASIGTTYDQCLLEKQAFETGLDLDKFKACIASGEKSKIIEEHAKKISSFQGPAFSKARVNGVPILDLYQYDAYAEVVNGILSGTSYSIRPPTTYSDKKPFLLPYTDAAQFKHSKAVDEAVGDAIDYYEELGRDEKLYLKVQLVSTEMRTDEDFQKLQTMVEDEARGTIENFDRNSNILYASMPASSIDPFSALDKVEKIYFDDKRIPSIPPKKPKPCPILVSPSAPSTDNKPAADSAQTKPVEPSEETAETVTSASAKTLEITLSLEGNKNVVISSDRGTVHIGAEGVNAIVATPDAMEFNEHGLNFGGRQVNVLPNEAIEKIASREGNIEIHKMELQNVLFKPIYEVSGEKSGKILGLISVEYPVNVVVNANDGRIEAMRKPWWSFLAG